jgi:signal peptidase II
LSVGEATRSGVGLLEGLRRWRPDWLMLAIGAILLVADQVSKAAIVSSFASRPPGAAIQVLGTYLRFVYTTNTGAAFGLFQSLTPVLAAISLISVPVLLYVRARLPVYHATILIRATMGLLLGGALGNFVDRAGQGYVVDFIDVGIGDLRWFPYNLSDASFVVGVAILAVYVLLAPEEPSGDATHGADDVG